jgi:hypothetical protein
METIPVGRRRSGLESCPRCDRAALLCLSVHLHRSSVGKGTWTSTSDFDQLRLPRSAGQPKDQINVYRLCLLDFTFGTSITQPPAGSASHATVSDVKSRLRPHRQEGLSADVEEMQVLADLMGW